MYAQHCHCEGVIVLSSLGAVVSRGWAKASACRLQITLSCAKVYGILSVKMVGGVKLTVIYVG